MATLTYYNFSKRSKSTKQPAAGSGTNIDVKLKGGADVLSPTFILDYGAGTFPAFNYVAFNGRFYHVKNIINETNYRYNIECEEDYLATHKATIGATTCQILYATGGRNDIIDRRIPTTDKIEVDRATANFGAMGQYNVFNIVEDNYGSVVISVVGKGSFGNYFVNAESVPDLLRDADVWAAGVGTDAATALQQFISGGSAANCLKNAIALPVELGWGTAAVATPIYLGNYPCTSSSGQPIIGGYIDDPTAKADLEIDIPWKYSDWRRHAPYSALFLYLPFFGTMSLPTDDLVNDTKLLVDYSLNVTSGDLSCEVITNRSGRIILTGSTNIAMSLPFGSANVSGLKTVSAIAPAVGALAAVGIGAAVGGIGIAAGATAIGGGLTTSALGLAANAQGESFGGGSLSGGASQGLEKRAICYCVSRELTDSQSSLNPLIGKPVMKKDTIGNYSGFVQTGDLEIDGAMLDSEREMINSLCNGGFYYE